MSVDNDFLKEVDEGLSAQNKKLSSKYFYDKIGDELFVKIMNMPEYYLTNSEYEIFTEQAADIIKAFEVNQPFRLYELGAGDGTKTIELLKNLLSEQFTYVPIDISRHAIEKLESRLKKELPDLHVEGYVGEYFQILRNIDSPLPKVMLFLGSNIGNMSDEVAKQFIKNLSMVMNEGDKLLAGFDLKKSSDIILPAYNDKQGYTAAFNLNLLDRINKELGGNFDLNQFSHQPKYDEEQGVALSYIVSKVEQQVDIRKLNKTFTFKKGEKIHTEISRKYDLNIINNLIAGTGLKIKQTFYDKQQYFCDILFEKERI